ncbi:MAG TPA: hypothetical protein VLE91_01330 [Candidatus Saccharimonadales bacterium]|nr:hypothetical protein [Candidatus Saccharimonadales bacterium]
MTDYHNLRINRSKKPKVRAGSVRLYNMAGILVVLILVFFVFCGILKSSGNSKVPKPKWDGSSAFSVVLNTQPVSVVVYNPNSKKITQVKLNDELYTQTGDVTEPLKKITTASGDGEALSKVATYATRAPVYNYIILKNRDEVNEVNMEKYFGNFVSFVTPVRVLLFGSGFADTNIARFDLLRLWWQAKGLSTNNLDLVETSNRTQNIILAGGEKVLGVDDVSMQRLFGQYMENSKVLEEGAEVNIINASGSIDAYKLASDLVYSVGGRVGAISANEQKQPTTVIRVRSSSYSASYLAKVFDCDIKSVPNIPTGKIELVLGADFLTKY